MGGVASFDEWTHLEPSEDTLATRRTSPPAGVDAIASGGTELPSRITTLSRIRAESPVLLPGLQATELPIALSALWSGHGDGGLTSTPVAHHFGIIRV
jgi:hypothetical protein